MQAISNGHNGQYFTTTPICDMLAVMSVGVDSKPGQTVADCARGSGRMLLAAAKINRHLLLYGADLDITCCKMALINMLLNSLQGEIAHINTLSNGFYRGFKVNTVLVGTHHYPFYTEFTEGKQSHIWLHDLKGTEVKLNLSLINHLSQFVHLSQSTVFRVACFEQSFIIFGSLNLNVS